MSNQDRIIEYVNKIVELTIEEANEFKTVFTEGKMKRRQFFIQPCFTARYRNFVVKGAMRGYIVDNECQEHTIQLAVEDWWISDYNSYIFQQPATMFVIAVEDSTVLQISFDNEQKLKAANHKFETFFRIIAERTAAFAQRRPIRATSKN